MAGIAQADIQYRDLFVTPVMEPVRLHTEGVVIDFFKIHHILNKDIYETRESGIRLILNRTPFLTDTFPIWTGMIAPVIEHAKTILVDRDITIKILN